MALDPGARKLRDAPAALAGEAIEKPDAEFVRARTGFAIGRVAPVAHAEPLVPSIAIPGPLQ